MVSLSHTCPGCDGFVDVDMDTVIRQCWFPDHLKCGDDGSPLDLEVSIFCGCGNNYLLDGPIYKYVFLELFKDFIAANEEH